MIYTAKKVADILGRPATTIRTWADKYKDFIPLGDKKAGRRRYNDVGLDVFKRIAELHDKDLMGEEVKEYLQKDFPATIMGEEAVTAEAGTGDIVLQREYQQTMNFFKAMLEKQTELISVQREELSVLKEALGLSKKFNPMAEPYLSRHLAIHERLAKRKVDKLDTIKRKVRRPVKTGNNRKITGKSKQIVTKRGHFGRFKKKSWLEKLFS